MALTSLARPDDDATITAVLGPTNTGKTHYAIERMLARANGVIGLPLRLLAREVYDKVVALRGPGAVALITGEEKIQPATARYFVCTVEAMPLDGMADFVAVDEIQLCADPDRGHVFTDRLLHARGRYETLFMGSDVIRPKIASLVPKARFMSRERFSTLSYGGSKKISRLKERTAVVAFSVDQVYAIAELIRRQRGGAAVVMGALSPRTRNAQVALYQNGDVDYLVATDAIGMGLNMDVDHVAFAGTSKFDGHRHRHLAANELAQIAGRAGRYTKDGSFGVTGEARPIDPEAVDAIENHRFRPLEKLLWRSTDLRFGSVPQLIRSLDTAPDHPDLARGREADDVAALRILWADAEVQDMTRSPDRVRLLWDVCQIPDFRKVMTADHVTLIARIYRFLLSGSGVIPSDWLETQVGRIDRIDGDIDALSKRLAFIRTWTYVANRSGWTDDPAGWRETTRAVEDRLSDALHARLTQRFVDRRTSVLMRRLKQKERLVAEVNDTGDVTVEGEFVGRLNGFRFTADEAAEGEEMRTLRSASLAALQAEFARRADKLYLSPDGEIDLTEQGGLMWGTDAIGALEKGDALTSPKVRVFVDDIAETAVAEKVERRLVHWVQRKITALFEPLVAMQKDETVTGLARGVAFRIGEELGIVPRREIADDVKALAQDERAMLRRHGVRFGQHNVFMPLLLKPAPTRMRLILWGLWNGFETLPEAPPPGHVTIPVDHAMPKGYYEKAGYRACGERAVRIDMLERLADMIRPMDAKAGFEATADMLSITGCTLDQFAEIMSGLGFSAEKGERPKAPRAQPQKPAGPVTTPVMDMAQAPEESGPSGEEAGPPQGGRDGADVVAEDGAPPPVDVDPAAMDAVAMDADETDRPTTDEGATPAESAISAGASPLAEPVARDAVSPDTPDAPPPAIDAPAMDAEAVPDDAPRGEEAAVEVTDTAGLASDAAGDLGGTTPEPAVEESTSETAADAAPARGTPAEAGEMEAFYTFTVRPRQRPNRGRRPAGPAGQRDAAAPAGEAPGQQRGRGPGGGRRQGGAGPGGGSGPGPGRAEGGGGRPPKGAKGGGPKGPGGPKGGRRPDREDGQHEQQRPPKRHDRPVDPDSPFAILQQLKNK